MKSQKGITLVSVALYIVLVFIVLAVLATVTSSFQNGVKEITQEGTEIAEINKFNMYFLQDVKKQNNNIIKISENKNEITFLLGTKYVFDNNKGVINLIELNNDGTENKTIKLAEKIEECTFTKVNENENTIIIVNIKAKNTDRVIKEYVLNNQDISLDYEDEKEYVY